jgi:endonuclease YncB( thermonuclease family)
MVRKLDYFILVLAIVSLFSLNYTWLDSTVAGFLDEREKVHVDRIIDGDTVEIGNESMRLLGINSPERGEVYYSEAKNYLEDLILGEEVFLEFGKDKKDKYNRTLAYVFLGNENVNKKLVEEGFANIYFYGRDQYYSSFVDSWEKCLEKNVNLCERSSDVCAECVSLKKLGVENQKVVLENNCDRVCVLTGWAIKDEGRKKFVFPNYVLNVGQKVEVVVGNNSDDEMRLYWKGEDYVWTETGDSLFLRDGAGKLVLWESY